MPDTYDSDLKAAVDQVAQQAAYAELRVFGWYPDGNGNVQEIGLSGGSVTQPGPGSGSYPDYVIQNYVDPGTDGGEWDTHATLGEIYRKWEAAIPPVFAPFSDLPNPADFQTLADKVRGALRQLSSRGSTGSGTSTRGTEGSANIDYEGNTTLGLANQVAQTLNTWQGAAATSFATYLNLFQVVVGNQALGAEVLRITLLMEKEMWTQLRADVLDMAAKAAQAYQQAGNPFDSDAFKTVLNVAGTVNTVLGWFPAFKPVTSATGTALSVTNLMVDTFRGNKPEGNNLTAVSHRDILPKLESAADKLKQTTKTVESDIQSSLRNLEKHVESAPPARTDGSEDQESFRLDRSETTYQADSTDDFIYPGVVVNYENVQTAANILVQDLAPEMASAARHLDEGDEAWPWSRDSSVGVGTFGCYSEYSAASYALEKEIEETSKEMEWAGEMLRAAAADIAGTDNNVSDDFNRLRGKIDDYDHPSYPVVTRPPGLIRPGQ